MTTFVGLFMHIFLLKNVKLMQLRKLFILISGLMCLCFASCITSQRVNYMQQPGGPIPSYSDTLAYTDYILQKGDRLYIRVYTIDEKTNTMLNGGMSGQYMNQIGSQQNSGSDLYTYLVDDQGEIHFPLIGALSVRGLTVREVKRELEKALQPITHTSSVEVRVVQRYFSVIGSNRSGRFMLPKEKVTIFEALAMAGDISNYGDRSKVRIIRESEDGTEVKSFDIRSKEIINSEYYYVEPNDVIYIQTLNEQFFSMTSFASVLSTIATTLSFGIFVYSFIDTYLVKPFK